MNKNNKTSIWFRVLLILTSILLIGEVFFPMINASDTLINILGGGFILLTIFLTIKFFNKL
jgi:hypothetical protein